MGTVRERGEDEEGARGGPEGADLDEDGRECGSRRAGADEPESGAILESGAGLILASSRWITHNSVYPVPRGIRRSAPLRATLGRALTPHQVSSRCNVQLPSHYTLAMLLFLGNRSHLRVEQCNVVERTG